MLTKKLRSKPEPSFDARFVWAGFIIFLVMLLVIGIAKFASLKILFWLK